MIILFLVYPKKGVVMIKEKGQSIVIFALVLVGLMGFVGFAIDGGMALTEKSQSQAVSDAISLTAAQTLISNGFSANVAINAALAHAATEGFNNDRVDNSVDIAITGPFTENNATVYYVNSNISSDVSTIFAQLFVQQSLRQSTHSQVRVQILTGDGPLFDGYGIVALDGGVNYPISNTGGADIYTGGGGIYNPNNFKTTGGTEIHTEGGPIYIESDLDLSGGAKIYTDGGDIITKQSCKFTGGSEIHLDGGNLYSNGNLTNHSVAIYGGGGKLFTNGDLILQGGTATKILEMTYIQASGAFQIPYQTFPVDTCVTWATPLDGMPPVVIPNSAPSIPTLPEPDCSNLPNHGTFKGTWDGDDKDYIQPGNYDKITEGSGRTLYMAPGLYCVSGDFKISGGADVIANEVFIYMSDGSDFTITGGGDLVHTAPTSLTDASGNEWGGMAMLFETGQNSKLNMEGGSHSTYSGTFYGPETTCKVTGGVSPELNNSQIICGTITVTGGTTLGMVYDGDLLYQGGDGTPIITLEFID